MCQNCTIHLSFFSKKKNLKVFSDLKTLLRSTAKLVLCLNAHLILWLPFALTSGKQQNDIGFEINKPTQIYRTSLQMPPCISFLG